MTSHSRRKRTDFRNWAPIGLPFKGTWLLFAVIGIPLFPPRFKCNSLQLADFPQLDILSLVVRVWGACIMNIEGVCCREKYLQNSGKCYIWNFSLFLLSNTRYFSLVSSLVYSSPTIVSNGLNPSKPTFMMATNKKK